MASASQTRDMLQDAKAAVIRAKEAVQASSVGEEQLVDEMIFSFTHTQESDRPGTHKL